MLTAVRASDAPDVLHTSSLPDGAFDNTDEAIFCTVSHSFPILAQLPCISERNIHIYNKSQNYFEICAA